MRQLSVLLVEDNLLVRQLLPDRYVRFFADCGYRAEIDVVGCNEGVVLEHLRRKWFHVLVTDISFGDLQMLAGFQLVRKARNSFPSLFIIANSGHDFGISRTVVKDMHYDLFIPKEKMLSVDEHYVGWFRQLFLDRFRINTELEIKSPSLASNFSDAAYREVVGLISRAMFTAHKFDEQFDPVVAEFQQLTRGYSDSRVYRVRTRSRTGGMKHIQSVVKVSTVEKAKVELENFERFVKWTLPFEWRVDLLGSAMGRKYGVVCYSFLTVEDDEFQDLEVYLAAGDGGRTRMVIEKIMDVDRRKWYRGGVYGNFESISQFYGDRYFREFDKQDAQRQFERSARDLLGCVIEGGRLRTGVGNEAPLPIQGVHSVYDAPCSSCIGHGDLHARNIMVSAMGKVVFIDFQMTGRTHVFEDFVVLEHSVRMHFPESKFEVKQALEAEKWLNMRCPAGRELEKYQLIAEIRRRAVEHFPHEPWQNYIFAVVTFGLRLLREREIEDGARRNVLCSIIAGCSFFEEIGGDSP